MVEFVIFWWIGGLFSLLMNYYHNDLIGNLKLLGDPWIRLLAILATFAESWFAVLTILYIMRK